MLDYDGTLSPIAQRPDLATLPPETRAVLERLANHPDVFVAIISGRSQANVKEMVGIEGITYAGNHGMEILHRDGSSFVHPMPTEYQGKLDKLLKQLNEEVRYKWYQTLIHIESVIYFLSFRINIKLILYTIFN